MEILLTYFFMMNKKQILSAVAVISLFSNAAFATGTLDMPAQTGAVTSEATASGMALTAAPTALSVEVSKVDFVDSNVVPDGNETLFVVLHCFCFFGFFLIMVSPYDLTEFSTII